MIENVETINSKLVEHLMTIPFPYSNILQEQINSAIYSNTISQSYYCIDFKLEKPVKRLPSWLDTMPLSWQIITNCAPLLCQLFLKDGYIEKLEIIDMALNNIEWDQIWTSVPLLDCEFDTRNVTNSLVDQGVVISKVLHVGSYVDFAVELGNRYFVASFRGCHVRRLISEDLPCKCSLSINEIKGGNYRYAVCSSKGNIDFDCEFMFIQWHKMIG